MILRCRSRVASRQCGVLFVPFVDKDESGDGDQARRKPRDHGRDYEGNSIYDLHRDPRADPAVEQWRCAGLISIAHIYQDRTMKRSIRGPGTTHCRRAETFYELAKAARGRSPVLSQRFSAPWAVMEYRRELRRREDVQQRGI